MPYGWGCGGGFGTHNREFFVNILRLANQFARNGSGKDTPPPVAREEGAWLDSRRIPAALARRWDSILLLELPHVGYQGFDVVVRHVFCRAHQLLAVFVLEPFLDGLEGSIVLEVGLHLGVGVIFGAHLLAHLGFSFAVGPVALGARFLIVGLGVSRPQIGRASCRERV